MAHAISTRQDGHQEHDDEGAMIARDALVPDLQHDEDLEAQYHGPNELLGYHESDGEEELDDEDGYWDDAIEPVPQIGSDHTHCLVDHVAS